MLIFSNFDHQLVHKLVHVCQCSSIQSMIFPSFLIFVLHRGKCNSHLGTPRGLCLVRLAVRLAIIIWEVWIRERNFVWRKRQIWFALSTFNSRPRPRTRPRTWGRGRGGRLDPTVSTRWASWARTTRPTTDSGATWTTRSWALRGYQGARLRGYINDLHATILLLAIH